MEVEFEKARWIRDLLRYLPLKSQFVLSGNIRDYHPVEIAPGTYAPQPLVPYLSGELARAGFAHIVSYNPIHGFRAVDLATGSPSLDSSLLRELKLDSPDPSDNSTGIEQFANGVERIANYDGPPIALLADFASRIINRPEVMQSAEQRCFTRALVVSHEVRTRPRGTPPRPFYNTIVWIVDKEGDLPDWFVIGNPRIRHIPLPKPDHIMRRLMAISLIRNLDDFKTETDEATEKATKEFVESTEGMLLVDMVAISQLCRTEALHLSRIADAVRHYKLGVTEDPWRKIDRDKITNGFDFISQRVKGQEHAVIHMLDIIKRAVTGVGATRRGGRPRGVAFLAGPTGVGKTELAKTVTSLLFGDDSAYIRFDMSEFSAEHSDQRLLGAPPGYVGYDVGGELTNAIREKPFSVVLFDEIEKAHPRILDKFLQILDDGVLTSGRGDRVYFSESFIIFTSNLGICKTNAQGERIEQVSAQDTFEDISVRVRREVDNHFKLVLGRPEILNRIGENIIVFDFIRPTIALQIFNQMVDSTISDLRLNQGIEVQLTESVKDILRDLCLSDLTNGGRGIRNKLEAHFVNPLARALFDSHAARSNRLLVSQVEPGSITKLLLTEGVTELVP